MTAIPLAHGDYKRLVAAEPYIPLRNRFCEENPTLNDSPVSLIARPATKFWQAVGDGPINRTFDEPGVFGGDLFVVSDDDLYRVSASTGTPALIGDLGDVPGDVSMAATAPIGAEPAHLFIATGDTLWLYTEAGGLDEVTMPEGNGAVSVAHINSYIIVVPVQSETDVTVGRCYWIDPGEITIDPADFVTAERAPDPLHQALTHGDLFWLFGTKTTEPWWTTGDPAAPMQRYTGIIYEHGTWEGTAVGIGEELFRVSQDGRVFAAAEVISRPDIEERIRRAQQAQAAA